jgi:hypothetical protein
MTAIAKRPRVRAMGGHDCCRPRCVRAESARIAGAGARVIRLRLRLPYLIQIPKDRTTPIVGC